MTRMHILVATPSASGSTSGNQVTAERWAGFLRELGHQVVVARTTADGGGADVDLDAADVLVALHARKNAAIAERFYRRHPDRRLVVVLTGTDLYMDLPSGDKATRRSLEIAHHLATLHGKAPEALPEHIRSKAMVIVQSSPGVDTTAPPLTDRFEVCVSGHLRPVKDPFRTAKAVRLLPAESRVQVTHIGKALDDTMADRARAEAASNPRYTWLGGVSHDQALHLQGRSRLLVLTSRIEGGANVICEALALSVPVISSRIDGSVGLLGEDYPGYFPHGNTSALADLLSAAENDEDFYGELRQRCEKRRDLVNPARECQAWADLLRWNGGSEKTDGSDPEKRDPQPPGPTAQTLQG